MKKFFTSLAIVTLIGGSFSEINAQEDISNIFKAGLTDLNKVANGYLKPAGNSFATGLGSNWYNTAEVHKTFGFDLTISAGAVMTPTADQTFDITGLTNLKPSVSGTTQAPTFAGKGDGVELNLMQPKYLANGTTINPLWNNGAGKITSFTTPAGVSKYIPTASLQFTIGLPVINDVSVRYMPKVSAEGFEASMWGIGIKHDIKRWIPVVKHLPFDASVMVGYTKLDLKYAFQGESGITPDKLVGNNLGWVADPTSSDYSNQGMNISADALTANLIVSKKLLFLTGYIGVGIVKTNFNTTVTGNYPTLGDPVLSGGTYKMQIKNITDPIAISSSEVMPSTTLGIRLKTLWIFAFHAQYTIQKYPTASVGFGINIR